MRYAIIAAGEGSRLAKEGLQMPKPLVTVEGERLIDRLLRIFMQNDATEIAVICNDLTPLVSQHLRHLQQHGLNGQEVPLRMVEKSTPTSMHSFFELSPFLADEPFCMTTDDTIFSEQEFATYIKVFQQLLKEDQCAGLMGVTDYIDDEKPLYVGVEPSMRITGFYDEPHGCKYISGGIYGLTPAALKTLRGCMIRGESRMRNFQRALVAEGQRLRAYPFSKVLDIDHVSDIAKAEEFLQSASV